VTHIKDKLLCSCYRTVDPNLNHNSNPKFPDGSTPLQCWNHRSITQLNKQWNKYFRTTVEVM